MLGFIVFIQSITCILLVVVILMQSGRGGGLTEAFASAENMFGAKTNDVMVRTTVVLASIFLISNLYLVHLSSRRERSLFEQTTKTMKKNNASQKVPAAQVPVTNSVADVK